MKLDLNTLEKIRAEINDLEFELTDPNLTSLKEMLIEDRIKELQKRLPYQRAL